MKKVLAKLSLTLVGIVVGVIINDIPLIEFENKLGLTDIFSLVFIVIVGYIFQNAQRELSQSFSSDLQKRDVAFSKRQKLLERLHAECFEAISKIEEIIVKNTNERNPLEDSQKKYAQLEWKTISTRIDRISKMCKYKKLLSLGGNLHDAIFVENFPLSEFMYNEIIQKDFSSKTEELKNKLDDLIYMS